MFLHNWTINVWQIQTVTYPPPHLPLLIRNTNNNIINQLPSSCFHWSIAACVIPHLKMHESTYLNQRNRNIKSERALRPNRRSRSSHQHVCLFRSWPDKWKCEGDFHQFREVFCEPEWNATGYIHVQRCLHGRQWWIVWFLEWTVSGAGCQCAVLQGELKLRFFTWARR